MIVFCYCLTNISLYYSYTYMCVCAHAFSSFCSINDINGKVGHLSVANLVDLYNDVETCWQFYLDSNTTVEGFAFGEGLSAQRFDATTDLSNLQDYLTVFFTGGCGDTWFADNMLADTGPIGGIGGPGPDGCVPGWDW